MIRSRAHAPTWVLETAEHGALNTEKGLFSLDLVIINNYHQPVCVDFLAAVNGSHSGLSMATLDLKATNVTPQRTVFAQASQPASHGN
jgi:hypothetical protein